MDSEENKSKIITVRGQQVILDSDVAVMCQVETKHINKVVKNNPDKFSEKDIITLTDDEIHSLGLRGKHKCFTEQGLYVLAAILKSPVAIEITFAINKTVLKHT
jgi:hypothetical protein